MRKRAAHKEALARRLQRHDRRHFELKLEYLPSPSAHQAKYLVEAFFFVPAALDLDPESDPPDQLFSDLHNYIRLTTPHMSTAELKGLPESPLQRALEEGRKVAAGGEPGAFVYECKLYASVVRASLKDLRDGFVGSSPGGRAASDSALIEELERVRTVAGKFRELEAITSAPQFPERARSAYRLADEYVSLSFEQLLRRLLVEDSHRDRNGLQKKLLATILDEESYRKASGYPSILDPSSTNEVYIYRTGLLKKYCSSVLYLRIRRSLARRPWQELFFAVAAGIAMAFATIVAFWAQSRYPAFGLRVFMIFVVGYMLKDRLKEAMRHLFSGVLKRHLYDWKIEIEAPSGGTLGTLREKIDYLPETEVPREVEALRYRETDVALRIAEQELSETIFRYRKEIHLDADRLFTRRGGAGVTDIMRFNVSRFLREMDEAEEVIDWIDETTYEVGAVKTVKVYHVDVVFRFTAHEGSPPTLMLARLILDRKGIKRIEQVQT